MLTLKEANTILWKQVLKDYETSFIGIDPSRGKDFTTMSIIPASARAGGWMDGLSGERGLPQPKKTTSIPIYGWRGWRVEREPSILYSTVIDCPWPSPVLEAEPKDRPIAKSLIRSAANYHRDFLCKGIFSYKTPKGLNRFHGVGLFVGKVQLLSEAIEHDYGWRAKKVIIRELFFNEWIFNHWGMVWEQVNLKAIEERYQCPVTRFIDQHEFIFRCQEEAEELNRANGIEDLFLIGRARP